MALVRPFDGIQPVDQLVGVVGDAEFPLVQVLFDDGRATALAVAIVAPHLLAGQGGVAAWTPVDGRVVAIGQAGVVELQEEPLAPLVVFRVAGNGLAIPGPHGAHFAQLLAHALDVGVGPLFRVDAVADGGVFGGQAEGVEADGEEDVVAVHAVEARAGVTGRHGVPVTGVQVAGWVGQAW